VARDLKRRKARERNALFVAEGVRTVEELARSPLSIEAVLATADAADAGRSGELVGKLERRGVTVLRLSEAEFTSAADTEHPQGVLAIARQPGYALESLSLPAIARLLVLDAIQDPGNVGTLLRTGAALGVDAVVALPGTVDLWNAKVVRSAVGTHFNLPAVDATPAQLDAFLTLHHVELWGTDAGGTPLNELTPPARVAIAMGNEGAGLSAALRERCSAVVSLPMAPGVESLNVAVAAGITLYALRP
jgi:TrmH family RNA methyltransferase